MSKATSSKKLRQPIVVVLGHVDHGKTTLLDKIRGTAVALKEPGMITQHVGASIVPASVIEKLAEPLKKLIPIKLVIPGLLFIDTPGHELFSNLRRRGGSIADFAILVVDVVEGFKAQTYESIEILKERKVPFLVAANKIDKIPGWKPHQDMPFIYTIRQQKEEVVYRLEELVYKIVERLAGLGFRADRFDRIKDFTRTVAVVPVSAKTGEGIAELLAVLAGLTQQYLKHRLVYAEGPAKGVVLEVKEEPGLGVTLDCIIYDGVIKRGDTIVVGSLNDAIVTRVRALLMPKPLQEIRAPEEKFVQVEEVSAAAGVKIAAAGLENVVAGSPLYVATSSEDIDRLKKLVKEEIASLIIRTDKSGIVVKADTLGTLEALVNALKRREYPVRIADIGPVTRRDVIEASIVARENKYLGVILAFNVKVLEEAEEEARRSNIRIFKNNVIYRLIEEYEEWVQKEKEKERRMELQSLIRPGKIRILAGYVFRRSNPVIVGIEVLGGIIRPGYPLMRPDGKRIGTIHQIQDRGKSVQEARAGMSVAISIRDRIMVGRHIDEGDILYTDIPDNHARLLLTKFKNELSDDEMMVLKEIISIKRKTNPFYGFEARVS